MSCCVETYNFGCKSSCDDLVLPGTWTGETALLTVVAYFNNTMATKDFVVREGEQMEVPNFFNEVGVTRFKVMDSDGNAVDPTYDCYKVINLPSFDGNSYFQNGNDKTNNQNIGGTGGGTTIVNGGVPILPQDPTDFSEITAWINSTEGVLKYWNGNEVITSDINEGTNSSVFGTPVGDF